MSFISGEKGRTYSAGYFLAHEECERKTRQVTQAMAVTTDMGSKFVPAGTIYPSNDSNAIGIVYEDTDVTFGDMPASVVLKGSVYEDRLPVAIDSDAKTALIAKGFTFATSPAVDR